MKIMAANSEMNCKSKTMVEIMRGLVLEFGFYFITV